MQTEGRKVLSAFSTKITTTNTAQIEEAAHVEPAGLTLLVGSLLRRPQEWVRQFA
jgi:hypothetical protein